MAQSKIQTCEYGRFFVQSVLYTAVMDNKSLAPLLFRVSGVGYLVFSVFYAPYVLFTAFYSGGFIISTLGILIYVAAGVCLLMLSKPLGYLIMKGLDQNITSPPPPPNFERS